MFDENMLISTEEVPAWIASLDKNDKDTAKFVVICPHATDSNVGEPIIQIFETPLVLDLVDYDSDDSTGESLNPDIAMLAQLRQSSIGLALPSRTWVGPARRLRCR
jgi:hypothetical protein